MTAVIVIPALHILVTFHNPSPFLKNDPHYEHIRTLAQKPIY
jgi:hypothetical protein